MRSVVLAALLASCVLPFAALPARATTVVPMSLAQIVEASDVVVEGEITAVESRLMGRRVLTFATVAVTRVLRGEVAVQADGARTVTYAVLGGSAGGLAQRVPGSPMPERGARIVVALSKADGPDAARHIIGFSQGLWRVDAAGRVLVVEHGAAPARMSVADLVARFPAPAVTP